MTTSPLLGTSLVVGGCGCIGYHIVRHLLSDPEAGHIHVLDFNTSQNTIDDASITYHKADISDANAVRSIMQSVKPKVVFHCASPIAWNPNEKLFYDTNVTGTKILLEESKNVGVKAFVFTSTADVYVGHSHHEVDETYPIGGTTPYTTTKIIAERMVLSANSNSNEDVDVDGEGNGGMKTVSIRPTHVYGERHTQGLYEILDSIRGSSPLIQIGNGQNYMELTSVDNVSTLHILAAKALINPYLANGRVSGEAFNAVDSHRIKFWHHVRVIWTAVRGPDAAAKPVVVPVWVVLFIVWFVGWFLKWFTLGLMKPPGMLRMESVEYCIYDHTYSGAKAKERLGFVGVDDHDRVMPECVRWELKRRGMKVFGEEEVKN